MTFVGILVGILILSLIMVVHESGHFFTGKALGFKIEEFSIFMGPVIFEKEKDGIRYNLKAIPIGASVRFAGEFEEEEDPSGNIVSKYDPDDPGLFFNRPKWRRALVVFMGPFVNFVTAFIAFLILFNITAAVIPQVSHVEENTVIAESATIEPGDEILAINSYRVDSGLDASMGQMLSSPEDGWHIVYLDADSGQKKEAKLAAREQKSIVIGITYLDDNGRFIVQNVDPNSNDGNPVLQKNDEIIAIEGIPFSQHERIDNIVNNSLGTELTIEIIRNGQRKFVESAPSEITVAMPLGLYLTPSNKFSDTIQQALIYPWSVVRSTVKGIGMIFSGQLGVKESLAGPIGIVSMVSDTVKMSSSFRQAIEFILLLFAMISVAVGFFNLLPIPPLDGGHLLFTLLEAIKRKPLSDRFKQVASTVGMIIFLALFILVIYLDASKLFGF